MVVVVVVVLLFLLLLFLFCFLLNWNGIVREGMYTERHNDRCGGRVPSKKRKTKVAILKSTLSLTGSQ